LSWAYVELIDRTTYLNHYYLVCLMAGLLALTPCGAALGVGARRTAPEHRVTHMPRFLLLVLRLQVAVVYIFAGAAKLSSDWLLDAQPLRIWLAAQSSAAPWLAEPACAFAASWLGAAFDLGIVALLLMRRTRAFAFGAVVLFHAATGLLFPIGMFPWIMVACATLFFAPDWPRVWLPARSTGVRTWRAARPLLPVLALHAAVQVLVPLHHLSIRDSAWTHQGFDFAWKVMVAEMAGTVRFAVRDAQSLRTRWVTPEDELTALQARALAQDPRLIVAYARHLARTEYARTGRKVQIFAEAFATLNGRPAQRLIAPDVDLAQEPCEVVDVVVPLRAASPRAQGRAHSGEHRR